MSTPTNTTPYPTDTPPPPPQPQRSAATKPLMIILAVVGAAILAFTLVSTLFSSTLGFSSGEARLTADATGVSQLQVNANAAQFDIAFDDVDEAVLATEGINAERWELHRSGDRLVVDAPGRWWNWCWFNCDSRDSYVSLTLPEELNEGNLNAELDLNAGRLTAHGTFDQLAIELNAGEVNLNGAARSLDAQVAAGDANLNLADVDVAHFEVAAGRVITELTGSAPVNTTIEVAAGQLDLTVPDGEYAVTSDAAAGNVNNKLDGSSDASNQITVEVAAGEVILTPGAASHQF